MRLIPTVHEFGKAKLPMIQSVASLTRWARGAEGLRLPTHLWQTRWSSGHYGQLTIYISIAILL